MLVIRRRAGESLLIGDRVEIDVLGVEGTQVKLGIRAPREIQVLRKEILITMSQNRAAARMSHDDLDRVAAKLFVKPLR